jgi:hypothetical protein
MRDEPLISRPSVNYDLALTRSLDGQVAKKHPVMWWILRRVLKTPTTRSAYLLYLRELTAEEARSSLAGLHPSASCDDTTRDA